MLDVGDTAPGFSVPLAGGDAYNDVQSFTLADALAEGPVVLAFVPAAFTSTCTEELCSFRDSMHRFDSLDAAVYGVSVDLPPALNVWAMQEGFSFPMLSDWDHDVIHAFGVVEPEMYGEFEVAKRSIFVLDTDGTVTYRWVEPPGDVDVDFGAVIDDVEAAVAALVE